MNPAQVRRLAARTCFQPYLNPAQLDEAIRTLDLGYQTDSPTAMIGYVKLIATQYGIDETTRKGLYSQFHQLLQQPLSYFESATTKPQATPAAEKSVVSDEAGRLDPSPPQPPHAALFAVLAEHVVSQYASSELLEMVYALCASHKQPVETIKRWQAKDNDYSWAAELSPGHLTTLVHWLYTAVCELHGPIEADQLFHEALAICQKHPEAKLFSPGNFF